MESGEMTCITVAEMSHLHEKPFTLGVESVADFENLYVLHQWPPFSSTTTFSKA